MNTSNKSVAEKLLPLFHPEQPMSLRAVERLTFQVFLETLRPENAIEIGSERGGTSRVIAEYATHLTCFDVDSSVRDRLADVKNIAVIIGNSATTVPTFIKQCEARDERITFAFVDGDHSYEAVLSDIAALLSSAVFENSVILVHDCAMEGTRRAFTDAVEAAAVSVLWYHSDFCQGYSYDSDGKEKRAGGLGLIVTGTVAGDFSFLHKEPDASFLSDLASRLGQRERLKWLRRMWRFLLPKSFRDKIYHWRSRR